MGTPSESCATQLFSTSHSRHLYAFLQTAAAHAKQASSRQRSIHCLCVRARCAFGAMAGGLTNYSGNIPKEMKRLASKLLAAQPTESAFADMVEGYDAELFLVLPRLVWLWCMITKKQSQILTRKDRLKWNRILTIHLDDVKEIRRDRKILRKS